MGIKVQLARNLLAEWFAEVVPMVHQAGYRVTPVYRTGATQPFSDGQTYPDPSDDCWGGAVQVGVILDDTVLLDYDGNKASVTSPIISLDDLV